MEKRNVIIVTDGDEVARNAVEIATTNIGGRCISVSAGNPTQLAGFEIVEQVLKAAHDPVVVMFDDNGNSNEGRGEKALKSLASYPQINILGAIAVASGTKTQLGLEVDFSIDRNGRKVSSGVDKRGFQTSNNQVFGDTTTILRQLDIPVVVGLGDPGKMDGLDDPLKGAPITTKALSEVIRNQNNA